MDHDLLSAAYPTQRRAWLDHQAGPNAQRIARRSIMTVGFRIFIAGLSFSSLIFTFPVYADANSAKSAQACETSLTEKICEKATPNDRNCARDTELSQFLNGALASVLDVMPPLVAEAVCGLDRIEIVDDWPENQNGAQALTETNVLRFGRGSVERMRWPLNDFILWDEATYRHAGRRLPLADIHDLRVTTSFTDPTLKTRVNFAAARIIVHEAAHLIEDRILGSDAFQCLPEVQTLRLNPFLSALPLRPYYERGQCLTDIPADMDSSLLTKLSASSFVSVYAACNSNEDFAETFSRYVLQERFGLSYEIRRGDEVLFSSRAQLNSPRLAQKISVIKAILSLGEMSDMDRSNSILQHLTCAGPFSALGTE